MRILVLAVLVATLCFGQSVSPPSGGGSSGAPATNPSGGANNYAPINNPVFTGSVNSSAVIAGWSGTCNASTLLGGDGACKTVSSAFSAITAGTNAAALVVGTGGSLDVSGSGTINATGLGGSAAALFAKLASPTFSGTVTLPGGSTFTSNTGQTELNVPNNTVFLIGLPSNGTVIRDSFNQYQWSPSVFTGYNNWVYGWSASSSASGSLGTGLSQCAAATVCVGNGTQGNKTGTMITTNSQTVGVAVGSLPACAAGTQGTRATVTDSNAVSFTAGIGGVVAAGGSTVVPVFCDGTNWRIG